MAQMTETSERKPRTSMFDLGSNGYYKFPIKRDCPNPNCRIDQDVGDINPGDKFGWECPKCKWVWVVEVVVSLTDPRRLKLEWKRSMADGRLQQSG